MSQASQFFPLQPLPPEVERSPRFSGLLEVHPLIDRPAPFAWRRLFHLYCEEDPTLDWKGAGFVLCTEAELDQVHQRLDAFTDRANRDYADHLESAAPDERFRLLNEGINHFSDEPGAHRIPFP
ncbi:hypothetical protein LG314_09170 [Agrococcus terreus]|uniref:hypothetical protein n=1 Tax=Agrococcus terreus TaxID=574649 RepID=UPI00384D4BFF